MEWGPEIAVNGVKPDWLNGRQACVMKTSEWCTWQDVTPMQPAEKWAWSHSGGLPCITAIKLPAYHFANIAIAEGFTPWGGGSEAPKDWDEGEVLLDWGQGEIESHVDDPQYLTWRHVADAGKNHGNIIGYHPKPIAQLSPADTVAVQMSEDEAREMLTYDHDAIIQCMTEWGFIRRQSKAERVAKSTNLPLADVERVLVALGEGE